MLSFQEELISLDGFPGLPSVHSFISLLRKCKSHQNLAFANLAHEHACSYGMEAHDFLGNHLVPTFVHCGSLPFAHQIFNRMTFGNEHSFTSLIQAYIECGESRNALSLYHLMEESGTSFGVTSFVVLLNACAQFKCLDIGKMLHHEIGEKGLEEDSLVSSALVNMYAKCGSLEHALEVFDKMAVRDDVAWTSLIAGYAQYGHGEKVLICLQQMELLGMSPDSITLLSGVKACACIGILHKGKAIHADIIKKGYEGDSFIGNSLVDMYSKCDSLVEAQEVFDRLPVWTPVSWNALITGYVHHNLNQEAMACFRRMKEEGISPDMATFCCILKACSTLAAIHKGYEIHAEICMKGWEGNLYVGTALVDMYVKCGFLSEACLVLDDLPTRNAVSWNVLIAGYGEHGLCEEALKCVQKMCLHGIPPDTFTYTCCLKAASISKNINMVEEIHVKIKEVGFMNDPFVGTTLVDTYVKCGSLAKAQEVFDLLPVRHIVSWTTLMAGYVEHGLGDKALVCFQQMQVEGITPNTITLTCALKACGSIGAFETGKEIHGQIVKNGLDDDFFLGNSLLDMYLNCGSVIEAWEVFDRLPERNVVSWTALIAGYVERGHDKEALIFFEQMQSEGVLPDAITFFLCLNACNSLRLIDKGQEIHAEIAKEGLEDDLFVGSSLVDMYAKFGLLVEAKEVLENLPAKDVVVWTALIVGFAEKALCEEALDLFQMMQLEGVSPDVISWNAVIMGFSVEGEIEKALKCFTQMEEQGVAPDCSIFTSILKASGNAAAFATGKKVHAFVCNGTLEGKKQSLVIPLMEMYCKCGRSFHAQMVFDEMNTDDLATWNALLTGYAHLGESENVFSLFERARHRDELTFLGVLNTCCHAGLLDKGLYHFKEMCKISSLSLTYEHCNCMIDLMSRAGHLDEAFAIVEKLPFQPDVVTWSIVLGACQKWGDVKLGNQAFECASRLKENRASAFIMMSNIYSEIGMCMSGGY